jgi:hypothetical protein
MVLGGLWRGSAGVSRALLSALVLATLLPLVSAMHPQTPFGAWIHHDKVCTALCKTGKIDSVCLLKPGLGECVATKELRDTKTADECPQGVHLCPQTNVCDHCKNPGLAVQAVCMIKEHIGTHADYKCLYAPGLASYYAQAEQSGVCPYGVRTCSSGAGEQDGSAAANAAAAAGAASARRGHLKVAYGRLGDHSSRPRGRMPHKAEIKAAALGAAFIAVLGVAYKACMQCTGGGPNSKVGIGIERKFRSIDNQGGMATGN